MPQSHKAIMLDNLAFAYQGKRVIGTISFASNAQKIGVLGRNGSGKSTLARLIAGLLEPSVGDVRINGVNVAQDRRAALKEVGILFQNPDHQIIFPTVSEEIGFGLTQIGLDAEAAQQRMRQTLARFDKLHWENADIHTLSHGQKQLTCLMAIVAMQPRLLILDEPFAGLDIATKIQLKRYLAYYQGRIFHITQEPDDIHDYDHILWLEQGAICQQGKGDAFLTAYREFMHQRGASDDISNLTD